MPPSFHTCISIAKTTLNLMLLHQVAHLHKHLHQPPLFLSWQDGKPSEPITAGCRAILLSAPQPSAGSITRTPRSVWEVRVVGASTRFSQEAQTASNIVLFPRLGELWVGGEKSSPEVSSSLGVYLLPVATKAVILPYIIQCSIET